MKQAKELHCQLEYVNTHQKCELEKARLKLETCHQELIENRASRKLDVHGVEDEAQGMAAKLKAAKHELKLVSHELHEANTLLTYRRYEERGTMQALTSPNIFFESGT